MKPEKNVGGRPRRLSKDFPEGWQDTLIEMGKNGMFDIDAKVYLHLSNDTYYRLLKEDPEFKRTMELMKQHSEIWWVNVSRNAFREERSKQINSNLYQLVMRNAFKDSWNEAQTKVDITTQGEKVDSAKKFEIEIVKTILDEQKK
jgi:hypothetical protein